MLTTEIAAKFFIYYNFKNLEINPKFCDYVQEFLLIVV